jgi:hypothetical protein
MALETACDFATHGRLYCPICVRRTIFYSMPHERIRHITDARCIDCDYHYGRTSKGEPVISDDLARSAARAYALEGGEPLAPPAHVTSGDGLTADDGAKRSLLDRI